MKYQITCDNCESKFIVESGEGATIECKCPSCGGIMEIALPLVNQGKEYASHQEEAQEDKSNSSKWLWGLVVVLLLIAIATVSYFSLQPSVAEQPVQPQTTIMDTIPYEQAQEEEPKPIVPDVEEAEPEVELEIEPEEEIISEDVQPEIASDSIQVENEPVQE